MKNCPKCGQAIQIPESPICLLCGADLTQNTTTEGTNPQWTAVDISKAQDTKIICPNCNDTIDSILTSICPHCGFRLGQENVKVAEEPKIEIKREEPVKPVEKVEIIKEIPKISKEEKHPEIEKEPAKYPVFVLLAIAAIIALVVIYFILQAK